MLRSNTYCQCYRGILRHSHKHTIPFLSPRGFTLIEVLVAMAILLLIVLMVSNMFSVATIAANSGNERAEVETAGRAALGFMSMKLSQAITGRVEPYVSPFYWNFNLAGGNNVSFYLVSDTIQFNRFYFDGSNLVYSYGTTNGILIDNVIDLKFYAYDKYTDLRDAKGDPFNCQLSNNLPYCVDIGIRLISSGDKKKAVQLSGSSLTSFMARNSRWFTTRVYFQTRQGYIKHEYEDWDSTK